MDALNSAEPEDHPGVEFIIKLSTVLEDVREVISLFCHYETIVRDHVFMQRQRRTPGIRALRRLRRAITSHLILKLVALWELPEDKQALSLASLLHSLEFDHTAAEALARSSTSGDVAELRRILGPAFSLRRRIAKSGRFKALVNLRNRAIAHSLIMTKSEQRGTSFSDPIHMDVQLLFTCTIWLSQSIERLFMRRRNTIKKALVQARDDTSQMWLNLNRSLVLTPQGKLL